MKYSTVLAFLGSCALVANANAALLGPSSYLQFSDSPFSAVDFSGGYFYLEDFEDHLQNTPGVSGDLGGVTSVVFGPSIHDSVDADDGSIDGSGLQGDTWYSNGVLGVTWTFDANVLGALPTHAGVVWTDGAGTITFEAFDAGGNSLGVLIGNHADGSVNGETAEDRFYGATNAGGISSIFLSNASGGIELDHLQYGNPTGQASPAPEPAPAVLLVLGVLGLALRRRRSAPR